MNYNDLIIIGASGGIGKCLVDHYRNIVGKIYGTYYKNSEGLVDSDRVHYQKLDVTKRHDVIDYIESIKNRLQRPVLIYAPAVSIDNFAHNYLDDDWDKTIAINLTGAMTVTKYLLPTMQKLNYGRIIYLSSILSQIAVPGTIAYASTKAALNEMAKVIAKENAKKNITANSLVLGYYNVGIICSVPSSYLVKNVLPNIPSGCLGEPENIINAINFLVDSNFVSGSAISMHGGM